MTYNKSVKAKLYRYFTSRLVLKNSTNDYLRGDCPYCGSKNTFGINIESLKINCFKNCGIPKKPLKLLMVMENLSTYQEARIFLSATEEHQGYERLVAKAVKHKEYNPIELPQGYTLISMGKSILADAARRSLTKRGFNIKKLAYCGVGYTLEGEYAGYLIFPFYDNSTLKFFQGRIFAGFGPKMKNPPEEVYGIGKSQLIYNRDALYMYRRVYVVESITNALTIGDNATALLGKKASQYQLSQLIKAPCEEIIIILDPDARSEAIWLALQLVYYKKIKLVYWGNLNDTGPDVNNLGRKETLRRVKATKYTTYAELIRLKRITDAEKNTLTAY